MQSFLFIYFILEIKIVFWKYDFSLPIYFIFSILKIDLKLFFLLR